MDQMGSVGTFSIYFLLQQNSNFFRPNKKALRWAAHKSQWNGFPRNYFFFKIYDYFILFIF